MKFRGRVKGHWVFMRNYCGLNFSQSFENSVHQSDQVMTEQLKNNSKTI